MGGVSGEALVQIHFLDFPVHLAARHDEHVEGLLREFALIARSDEDDHHVPARLLAIVDTITEAYDGLNDEAGERVDRAIAAGDETIPDHVGQLPATAAPVVRALSDLLEEADGYCRQGQHLLTMPAPPDVAAFRRWYRDQLLAQLAGGQPVSWPESQQARSLTRVG
jgi:hypothetical protein